jgi:hypothetical protein
LLSCLAALAPAASSTSFGSHGSRVVSTENDYAVTYQSLGALVDASQPVVCRITAGSTGILDDYYVLHWGTSCTTVAQGDIRLTTTNGGSAGTPVLNGATDKDTAFTALVGTTFLAGVGYLETDGLAGYTPGDFLYYSADGNVDVTNGDIRLFGGSTNSVSSTAGTVVGASTSTEVTAAGDGDGIFPESVALQGQGTFTLRYFDANANGAVDKETDPIYLTAASPNDHPRLGDVHLDTLGGQTFGARVIKTSTDYKGYQLTTLASSAVKLVTTDSITSPLNSRHLYGHFPINDGVDASILAGDLIFKSGSGAMGNRVTSVADGQTEVISSGTTPALTSEVFFVDADSNLHYTPASDPVYLHRPTVLGGTTNTLVVTPGDVRLTSVSIGGTTYAAGTIVVSGDLDVSAYASSTANAGLTGTWFIGLHDVDQGSPVTLQTLTNGRVTGDSTFNANVDGVYIAAGSTVADGDRRLFPSPNLGGTTLVCGSSPAHADCGTSPATADVKYKTITTGGTFSVSGGAVYYDADSSGTVTAGDSRLYHNTLAAGTVAGGDSDVGTTLYATTRILADSSFAFGTTRIYYDSDALGTINNGDIRIRYPGGGGFSADTVMVCTVATYNLDCGAPVTADSYVRITGTDGTWTTGKSEYVYYSKDTTLNAGDRRFQTFNAVTPGIVAASDADVTHVAYGATDELYLQWCEGTCAAPVNDLLHPGDLLFSSSGTTRITASSTGHVVTLTALGTAVANQAVKRFDAGSNTIVSDDTFYLAFGATATNVAVNDFRLTPYGSKTAGQQLASGDSTETSQVVTRSASAAKDLVKYVDLDGVTGYTSGDAVYVDNNDLGGSAGLGQGDIRLTAVSAGGTTYSAGTIIVLGDKDVPGFSYAGTQPTWTLYMFDEDRDGVVSAGDTVYANPGAATTSLTPSLLAVRIGGTGVSTGIVTPPSTGGGTPATTTSTDTSTVTTTTTTTTTTTSGTTTKPASTGTVDLAAANIALAASLTVTRDGSDNVLAWQAQAGVMGYQVWRHTSPWSLVTSLDAATTTYRDADAPKGAVYLVTAYSSEATKLTDIVTQDVPGLGANPTSDHTATGGPKGAIPASGLLLGLGALGVCLLLARRRL